MDALGNTTSFTYNGSKGNVTGVTRINRDGGPNSVSEFGYDGNGNKTSSTSYRTIDGTRRALTTTMGYDGEDRLFTSTSPLGVAGGGKSITRYNLIGKVYESVRAAGTAKEQTTSHDYDVLGRRKSTTYPDGTSTRVVYNDNDQVEQSFDRSGRSSLTVYDGLNRAVGSRLYGANGALVTLPNSSNAVETLSVYDGAERTIASRDERGHWSRTVYDDAGRTTRSEDEVTALDGSKQLLTSTTVLDDDGRTAYTLDPQQTRTEWRYDDAGRVLETHLDVRYNPQTGARSIYAKSQTSYDVLGRATKETNPSNQWKSYDYDSLGRLRAVMQPQDGTASRNMITRFGYDEAGLKMWQQDAKGYEQDGRPALTAVPQARVTRFAYDVAGRSIARQMPELVDNKYLIERTGYDELGREETHTDFRGYTSTMSYDVRGRMLSKVPDSRLNEKGLYMGYPDEFTTVVSRGNGAGALVTTSISDTQRGWLSSVTSPTGTLTYGYDVGGNRTSVTHERGSESFTTNYGYDELSRLVNVSDGTTELARIGYDLKGNREQVLRANGVNTGYQFDNLNRLKKLTHAKGQTVLSSFDYTVRQDGKRTGVTEKVVHDQTDATPRTSNRDVGFTYDDAGRLTKESGADGLGVAYENAWQYDAAGNRAVTTYKRATVEAPNTVATTTSIASVFTGNDWLKEQTSTTTTAGATNAVTTFNGYDANGAQTHERVGVAGSVEVNEWNFDGTLASTETQGQATGGSEFVYDASGNRLKQRTKIGKPEAKEVRYLVDPNTTYAQVVQERDENNVLQARYAWEDGLAPLVMWRRTNTGAYATFFYLCDGQDSVRQLTDASGKVTDSYFYDAFGNALQGGSGDTPNTFRYTGQQLDPSGDYFLRARYYNSGTGRFLSHDRSIGGSDDAASMHRYLYASNDGINFSDPSGEESLGNVLSSIGVNASLAHKLSVVWNIGSNLANGLQIFNIGSDLYTTGTTGWTDVALLAAPAVGKLFFRGVRGLFMFKSLFTKPVSNAFNAAAQSVMRQKALSALDTPFFGEALAAYNKTAGLKRLPKVEEADIVAALADDVAFYSCVPGKAAIWSKTHFGRFKELIMGSPKEYWLQFSDDAYYAVNSERALAHELLHLGAMKKGQQGGLFWGTLHEIKVTGVTTPDNPSCHPCTASNSLLNVLSDVSGDTPREHHAGYQQYSFQRCYGRT